MFQARIRANRAARWLVPLADVRTTRWLSLILVGIAPAGLTQTPRPSPDPVDAANTLRTFLSSNCYTCHGSKTKMAGMDLEAYASRASILEDRATGESVLRMLKSGLMPPASMPRPNEVELRAVIKRLEDALEKSSPAAKPDSATTATRDPGDVPPHRLNRTEYNNTIRDLLGVDIHAANDFPQDDAVYGFDNIADSLSISPLLMEKYIAASEKIAHAAIFGPDLSLSPCALTCPYRDAWRPPTMCESDRRPITRCRTMT